MLLLYTLKALPFRRSPFVALTTAPLIVVSFLLFLHLHHATVCSAYPLNMQLNAIVVLVQDSKYSVFAVFSLNKGLMGEGEGLKEAAFPFRNRISG